MRRILVLLGVGIPSILAVTWTGMALAQPANPLEGWKYPGAKRLAGSFGGGIDNLLLATPDEPDKVVAFYGKKVGVELTHDTPGGSRADHGNGEFWVDQDDSIALGGLKGELRPVVVRIFVQKTKDHYLTLVITRAKGEDQTHISLTDLPK